MTEQSTTSGGNVCPYCHLTIMAGTVHACLVATQSLNAPDLPYGEAWKIKAAKEAARADKAEAEVRRLRAALQECLARATWDETCQCSDCKIYREIQTVLDEEPPCPSETKP